MDDTNPASPSSLSDSVLLETIRSLVSRERHITARLVAHLAEMDTRALYLREGFSSLFVYCRDALGLSEHEAYGRIEAARAGRRFPMIFELLHRGEITLTAVSLLARHLTVENHLAVLDEARGMKKAQVEELVARLHPRPDVPDKIRQLPPPPPAIPAPVMSPAPTCPAPPMPRVEPPLPPRPLAPDRYKYQLTIDGETRDLLAQARDLLRHAGIARDDGAILKRALRLLVDEQSRRRYATTSRPRPGGAVASQTRHVPAAVKRTVFERDQGRCAYVAPDGHRCTERALLEFHHVKPFAVGGETSAGNLALRCRSHNGYEARVYFDRGADSDSVQTELRSVERM